MIIDILAVSKIRLNYQKVYHENTRCWRDRKYWYSWLQGDRRHAGTPEDGVISREQIAQVLVTALSNDAAKNKTFELVAERGEAQQDLTPLFAELRNDNPQKNDGVFDIDNMPLTEEPECVINDLNLYSKNSKI